jgi:hypothetical protein
VLVEAGRDIVDRVDHHEPRGDRFRRVDDACEGVGEQRSSQPSAVERSIECEPREQHGWDLARSTASDACRQVVSFEQVGGQCVVTDDLEVTGVPDERARRASMLRRERVLFQPVVELRLPTLERVKPMFGGDRFGDVPRLCYWRTTWRARSAARFSAALATDGSSRAVIS